LIGWLPVEGVAFKLQPTQLALTVPVYRLHDSRGNRHFYTTSQPEKDIAQNALGFIYESIIGYAYATPAPGTVSLHRLYSQAANDHLYTQDENEMQRALREGFNYEGIQAYVCP
jgi:hypothetical protein